MACRRFVRRWRRHFYFVSDVSNFIAEKIVERALSPAVDRMVVKFVGAQGSRFVVVVIVREGYAASPDIGVPADHRSPRQQPKVKPGPIPVWSIAKPGKARPEKTVRPGAGRAMATG